MTSAATLLRLVDVPVPSADGALHSAAPAIADIVGVDEQGRVSVGIDGIALHAVCLDHVRQSWQGAPAELQGRQALVDFVNGDRMRPVIVGLIGSNWPSERREPRALEARIDGAHVLVDAGKELTLRCGKASVTLTADGKIVIKGMEIVSRAMLAHKIKGGTVNIN